MKLLRSLVFLLFTIPLFPQTVNSFDFFPEGLNFLPLRGNNQEAKLGVLYYPNTTNLKVDIGNCIDLFRYNLNDKNEFITAGIEFMAYAYSISYSQLRLQIGAVDGFFGGNAVYTKKFEENFIKIRFRYIHNSAHLVDGFYDLNNKSWMNNKEPIPFTRDFAELLFSYESFNSLLNLRPYIGGSFAARIRPEILKRGTFFTGLEIHTDTKDKLFSTLPYKFFMAYHFQLAGLPAYQGSNHILAGIKFGEWQKKGINFYLSYFRGNNMFNEFFDQKIERFGIGFNVDF